MKTDWARVKAIVDTTCRDTSVSEMAATLFARLRAEFDQDDPSHRPPPSERARAIAKKRLKELGY